MKRNPITGEKLYKVTIPSLIRDTLGDEIADQMQKVLDEAPQPRREVVIYTSELGLQVIRQAIWDVELRERHQLN